MSPKGIPFTQNTAKSILQYNELIIVCGRFEGIDQRLLETRNIEEYSIGDFILSGGETASFVFIDSVIRLLPGVLGNPSSLLEESFNNDLIEHQHYTKPEIWQNI